MRLFRPQVLEEATGAPPGVVTVADPRLGLRVATGSGELGIAEVQPAGKRRMEAAEWVRGRGIAVGQQFC